MILRPSGPTGGTVSRKSSGLPGLRDDSCDTMSGTGLRSDTEEDDDWDSGDEGGPRERLRLQDSVGSDDEERGRRAAPLVKGPTATPVPRGTSGVRLFTGLPTPKPSEGAPIDAAVAP